MLYYKLESGNHAAWQKWCWSGNSWSSYSNNCLAGKRATKNRPNCTPWLENLRLIYGWNHLVHLGRNLQTWSLQNNWIQAVVAPCLIAKMIPAASVYWITTVPSRDAKLALITSITAWVVMMSLSIWNGKVMPASAVWPWSSCTKTV